MFRELHEVTLHKGDLVLQTSVLRVLPRSANLEVVVVKSDNLRVGELGNFTCGAADTAANVEDAHTGTKDHVRGEIMLMTGQGSKESLSFVETREVEGL